ncbi:hypothetical protein H8356DRAFT_923207, partial [Neocallimastix lanati (nom. inval.)]
LSVIKHITKEEIRKSSISLYRRPKYIHNEISHEMDFICPEYSTIRPQIIISINK